MRRPRLTVLAIGSTFLAIGLSILWLRSGRLVDDHFAWHGRKTWLIQSRDGRLWFERWIDVEPVLIPPLGTDLNWQLGGTTDQIGYSPPPLARSFGFDRNDFKLTAAFDGVDGSLQMLGVPFWAAIAPLILAPVVRLSIEWRDHRRRNAGTCPACGYDLRASFDRCPECGVSIANESLGERNAPK